METIKQYYRVDRRDISFFKYILEGYDNLGVLTTLDALTGNVVLSVVPGCEQDITRLIRSLQKEMLIEPAPAPDTNGCIYDTDTQENNSGRYDGT